MKYSFSGALALLIVFTACQKTPDPSPDQTGTDSAKVTVVNGYGSGTYKIGDTVHIWSNALPDNMVFDQWTGFNGLQQNSGEWHNSFVMPAQNVTVTAVQKAIPAWSLKNEKIKGVNILKNVYYYFPNGHKGIVYLLHGSGGSARNLVSSFEWIQMMNDLVVNKYAIIVTEAEEVSLDTDLNGNGKLQWKYAPLDSTGNVDYGNIKALRDTFYARGYTNASIPQFSIGMSNGGAFSSALSALFKFKSGISYCAPGIQAVLNTSSTPFQFCMAKYDDAPEVGAQGNADALTCTQLLMGRSICSKYFVLDKTPVYPERFARWSNISIATSAALFNELKNNNWLDSKNYLKAASDSITTIMAGNPSAYPTFGSLNLVQLQYVSGQIDVMYAGHQFYSDLNKTTIRFFDSQCQ